MSEVEPCGAYREAAPMYHKAGWRGVLPLPPNSKQLTLKGFTGHAGTEPSYADIQTWMDGSEGDGNIALRLPDGVLGIDVDNYGGKHGLATLLEREEVLGILPETWRSSARAAPDHDSGIYFYRVPPELSWPGQLGENVELIQRSHRYAVVWPSVHPETKTKYRWYSPAGVLLDFAVPKVEDLAELPASWVDALSIGPYVAQDKVDGMTDQRTATWISEHDRVGTCRLVRHAVLEISTRFRHSGSRHGALNQGLLTLARYGEQGHQGLIVALTELRRAFAVAASDPSRDAPRSDGELVKEWGSSLRGAVALVLAQPTRSGPVEACVCDMALSALVPPAELDDGRPRATVRHEEPARQESSPTGQPEAATAISGVEQAVNPPASELEHEIRRQYLRNEAQRILDERESGSGFTWPGSTFSLTEELDVPDEAVLYTVQHVMPTGANVLLAAQYKAGKTTMMNNLARSLADGTPFLGRFSIANLDGRVALWNYEVDRPMYRRWLRDMKITNSDKITPFNLRGYRMPLLVKFVEDQVVEWLKRHEIAFWVIDPFARAFVGSGDENSNNDVGKFLDTLDVIKRRAGVRDLVLPTHTGRAEQVEGAEHARGATRLDDWADVRWLLIKDREAMSYYRATGRDVDWPETQLAYDVPTRTLSMSDKSRGDLRSDQMMTTICAVVRRAPGIGTRALRDEVKDMLGTMSVKHFDEARGILKRAGKLRTEQSGSALVHHLTASDDLV